MDSLILAQNFDHTFLMVVKLGCLGVAIAILTFGIIDHQPKNDR